MVMPNYNTVQAGTQITRGNLHWGPTLGQPAGPISFGFRATAPTYNDPDHDNFATFTQVTATQMTAARNSLLMWADVANITFNEVNAGGYTNNATILFGNYFSAGDASAAYAKFPGTPPNTAPTSEDGDVWLNIQNRSTTSIPYGSYDYTTFLHEIGHALGLQHPGDYNAAPGVAITYGVDNVYIEDTRQFSLMSYFNADNTGANHIDPLTGNLVYASTPLLHDIAAIQRLYGLNLNTRVGDSQYGFFGNTGRAYDIGSADRQVVFCIWDAGGNDWLNVSGYTQGQRIDLRAGNFSDIGALTLNVSIADNVEIENAVGGAGSDSITGNGSNNILNGLGGHDNIVGLGGADVLHGNEGNDTLDGGIGYVDTLYGDAGNDWYIVNDLDTIVEFANFGTDTVISSIQWVLGDNLENLVLKGTASVNGFGNGLANSLTGNSGANYLDGGAELDTLAGGAGNDTYALASSTLINGGYTWDNVIEALNAGVDTVYASADVGRYTYQLTANVENLIATGTSIFRLWGNEIGNTLTGNDAANEIAGFDGNDILDGNAGRDILTGGLGNDFYELGDRFFIGQFEDFAYDTIIEDADAGIDFVNVTPITTAAPGFASNYTLGANVENGALVTVAGPIAFNLTGNALDNFLTGSSGVNGNSAANGLFGLDGNDTLNGLGSLDVLVGGTGNDTYILSDRNYVGQFEDFAYDTVVEDPGAGTDTVYVTPVVDPGGNFGTFYTLAANVENGVVAGTLAFTLAGNALDNRLTGNAAANTLNGSNGNDTLQGGAGADTLEGGLGDDVFYVDTNGDRVVENAGEGYDRVYASASFSLSQVAEVEYLATANATGTAGTDLTGSNAANTIVGDAGSNSLTGRGGADALIGGAGLDFASYAGDAAVIASLANSAINTGDAAGDTYNSIENLIGSNFNDALNGDNGINDIRGDIGQDILKGYGGDDKLYGQDGNDTLIGGVGADYLSGSAGFDAASYAGATARVIVSLANSSINTGDGAGDSYVSIENLTGSSFNDALNGDNSANVVNGGAGNDFIKGYGGNDTLTGGTGEDSFIFNTALAAATNVDAITDFSVADDTIQLDDAIFAAIAATGALLSGYFRANTTGLAQDDSDRIIYETDTGELYYDSNGNVAGGSVLFAKIAVGLNLTNADFSVA